jgi:hypothetical protein
MLRIYRIAIFFILSGFFVHCELARSMQLTKRSGCLKGNCYYGPGSIQIGENRVDGIFKNDRIYFHGQYRLADGGVGDGTWEIKTQGDPVSLDGHLTFSNGDAGDGEWQWENFANREDKTIYFAGTRIFRNGDKESGRWDRSADGASWVVRDSSFVQNKFVHANGTAGYRYYLQGKSVTKAVYDAETIAREKRWARERELAAAQEAREAEFKRLHGNETITCTKCGGTGGKQTHMHYDAGGKSNCRYTSDTIGHSYQTCDVRDSSWTPYTTYCELCHGSGKIWRYPKYHPE